MSTIHVVFGQPRVGRKDLLRRLFFRCGEIGALLIAG